MFIRFSIPLLLLVLACTVLASNPVGSQAADALLPANRPITEVVDHYIDGQLTAAGIQPAPPASDGNLIRRITLDLAGRIPSYLEAQRYVDSSDSQKRQALVDRLMASPEFVDHQSRLFDTFVSGSSGSVRNYLKVAFEENLGWDQMFRDIVLANYEDERQKQAVDFLKQRVKDTDQLTNDVSVVFFGVNISCAKCHDHPLVADLTQDYFYGMKSFFNRTFENGGFVGERDYGLVDFKTVAGDTHKAELMFLTGKVIEEPPHEAPDNDARKKEDALLKDLAKKKEPPPAPKFSRRAQLVDVALAPEQQTLFAKAVVNRVWHQLTGQGLVMPLDQMHADNPPSHPQLLEWLARDLVAHDYDLRRLVQGLILTDTYARASSWSAPERPAANTFAVGVVRPLAVWQYARSLSLAVVDPQRIEDAPDWEKLRATSAGLAAERNSNWFDQPRDDFQVSADEALLLTNGEDFAKSYLRSGLAVELAKLEDREQLVQQAVWSILSRPATPDEVEILTGYLSERQDRHEASVQQIVWALLASTEFRFNY